jgi:hypothetical protein
MNAEQHCAGSISTFAGTRDDFIRAMKSLGAKVEHNDLARLALHPLRVLLRCPTANWARLFGPVGIAHPHFGPGGHTACEAWEYQCTDGAVLCVGCQRTCRGEEDWVMVRALYWS